ncbi:hypothetical protein ACFQJC_05020 [Haloferax namakaokahaiae]|uniref:Phosphotransferase system, HPr-related protein n=1 Tax=Haloferax namakaokahaiae TaxID=1748331 RepID=A0ABD5ZC74_9EURY
MRYLHHDSEESAMLRNQQVLGDDSPLEFDEEGVGGPVDDDTAQTLSAMHRHVTLGRRARDTDGETPPDEAEPKDSAEAFDAEAFVDRTPMSKVTDDLDSGAFDDHLDAIADAESDGRDRDGVNEAIEARRE